ncbi:hypothetical protein BJ912DRAFT_636200 [Pholiota molesta]|nr:hypothetical protein BJ912DRAFT_636200 [Pholiota molesta]
MFSFKSLLTASLIAMAGVMKASAAPAQGCFIPPPGNYSLQSVAFTGELVGLGQPNGVGFTLVMEKAPPQGNLGVWTLTNADQGGFHILNVEETFTVSTIHFVESNLFLPEAAVAGTPPSTYAIQCAGNGEFVIKAVDDDLLWTTVPGTRPGDEQQGVSTLQMLPADGSNEQHFLLNAL